MGGGRRKADSFSKGQRVEITDGVLKGRRGRIVMIALEGPRPMLLKLDGRMSGTSVSDREIRLVDDE